MRPTRSALNKTLRDLQKARETYRYRTYFWSQTSPGEIGSLLIGASWIQGNAKRRRGKQVPMTKNRLWSIRQRLASGLQRHGLAVLPELAQEYVPYPFRFGALFQWQRALKSPNCKHG